MKVVTGKDRENSETVVVSFPLGRIISPTGDLSPADAKRCVFLRRTKIIVTERELFLQEKTGITNGAFLKGGHLNKGAFYALHNGDEVRFSPAQYSFNVKTS